MTDDTPRILLIDDDADYLDALRAILEDAGYRVLEAKTGEEGIRLYRREEPDLVIVDLMMEEVDAGTRFVRELRALGSRAPILMATSLGDELSLTTSSADLGLAGLLQKPIDPDTLLRLIASRLAHR